MILRNTVYEQVLICIIEVHVFSYTHHSQKKKKKKKKKGLQGKYVSLRFVASP